MKEIYEEFDRLLQFKSDESVPLGDFYVSTLSFQHYSFDSPPVISLAILINERKFQKHHKAFLEAEKEKIPRLSNKTITIITDR